MYFVLRIKLALVFVVVFCLALRVYSTEEENTAAKVLEFKNVTFVISASKIPTQDEYSEVDAFVKVSSVSKSGEKEKLGTTGIIRDEASPQWHNVFWVEWRNGTGQKLEFIVKDHDISDWDDDAGEAILDLDEFVANDQNTTLGLSKGGELFVRGTRPFHFKVYARNVPELDCIKGGYIGYEAGALGDTYVDVYWRQGKERSNNFIGSTSVMYNIRDPDWPELFEFTNYQKGTDQYLFFQVKDRDVLKADDHVGDYLLEADSFVKNWKKFILPHLEKGARSAELELGIVPIENVMSNITLNSS